MGNNMFENFKKKRALENDTMDKILQKLSNTSRWYKVKYIEEYKHLDSGVVIRHDYDFGGVKYIKEPVYYNIPFRYRKQFQKALKKIEFDHANNYSNLLFLNQYVNDVYVCCFTTNTRINESDKILIWLTEQSIKQWYSEGRQIWFKNEEDAVAFKLKWSEVINDSN